VHNQAVGRDPLRQYDRQTGSYSKMGSEKYGNPAKSGYIKGTIRSDLGSPEDVVGAFHTWAECRYES
jgi:hypothetical protein